jgi:uncharacterized protein
MSRRLIYSGFIALIITAGALCGPATAQQPSADAMAAARELITVMRSTDQLKLMLPNIMQALKPAIVQGRPQIEQDFDTVMPLLIDGMTARLGQLVDQMASVYARNFTPAEMREMTAFYRGPVGQKFLEKMPTVMQESMQLGQSFGQQIAGEMQSRMVDELRKKGHKL